MESNNPTCKQIEESLDAFHDGELAAAEQSFVEEHLKDCSTCLRKVAEIERLVQSLKAVPRLQASTNLSSKLDLIVDRPNKPVAFRPKFLIPVAAAAAILVIAFGVRSGIPGTGNGALTVAQAPKVESSATSQPIEQKATLSTDKVVVAQTSAGSQQQQQEIRHNSPEAATNNGQAPKLALAPTASPLPAKEPLTTSYDMDYEQIAELPTTTDSFTDAIGFATDEDGLYDIKM